MFWLWSICYIFRLTKVNVEGTPIPLRFVKFQNVLNIQIFIKDNQVGSDVTRLDHLAFYGSPINTTNMGDFKRVAGKKGESHWNWKWPPFLYTTFLNCSEKIFYSMCRLVWLNVIQLTSISIFQCFYFHFNFAADYHLFS